MYLIDWEYSGMFDPLCDVATLFVSFQFTEEELFFLTYYLGREPNKEELHHIFIAYHFSRLFMVFMDRVQGNSRG